MQDEITQENNFRGTTAHRCCTEAFQLYPGNGLCKKQRFDRYQTIVVKIHDCKLRGHHPFYKTVWIMAHYQRSNWKNGATKLNLRWNFSRAYGLTSFPLSSAFLRCHLAPSKRSASGRKSEVIPCTILFA